MTEKLTRFVLISSLIVLVSFSLKADEWNDIIDKVNVYIEAGDYHNAMPLAQQAMSVAKRDHGTNSIFYAQSIGKVASILYLNGNYQEAAEVYTEQKGIYESVKGRESDDYVNSINNLCASYQKQGKYSHAEPLLRECLEMKRNSGDNRDMTYARTLNNLAQLYHQQGFYSKAEPMFLESLEIKKGADGENSESYATSLFNMGVLYKSLGNFNKSLEYTKKSVDIYRKSLGNNDPKTANAIYSLAMIYLSMDNEDDAAPLLKEAKALTEKQVGKGHPDYASMLYRNAILQWMRKNYTEAEKMLNESMAIIESKFGNGHPLYASCLNSLGVIALQNRDFPKAAQYLTNAVYLRENVLGKSHPEYAMSVHNLAGVYRQMGDTKKADEYYKLAFSLYLEQIDNYFPFLSESEKAAFYASFRERFEMFNCYVLTRLKDKPSLAGDMYDFQLQTKALLLNNAKNVRNKILNSGDEKLRDIFEKWRSLKEKLAAAYNMSRSELAREGIDLKALEDQANTYEKDLSKSSSVFDKEYNKRKVSWKDIRKKLKKDEAAVEMIRFRFFGENWTDDVFYAAIIVTKETKDYPDIVLLKNGKELENLYIRNYNKSIKHKIPDTDSYEVYWKAINEKLKGKKVIYLSPDGIYNKININTLQCPVEGYMIDKKYIRLLTNSADILKDDKGSLSLQNGASFYGYPDFNSSHTNGSSTEAENEIEKVTEGIYISELPGTKTEVEKISGLFKDKGLSPTVYLSDKANEHNIKTRSGQNILHIATHGFFLEDPYMNMKEKVFGVDIKHAVENPLLRSALLFSGASGSLKPNVSMDGENGILYAYEAMNMDLEKTDLVVLSACETALGTIRNGEGVYGLQRAFQVAGARFLIMSLWKINDRTSQELMTEFYSAWLSGVPMVDAFKKAQLKIKEKYQHPYYWGAFVLIGN